MIQVLYTSAFLRRYKKLSKELQEDVKVSIQLLEQDPKDARLKTHRLQGKMKKYWSFRVNYRYRIIFEYDSKTEIALLDIGDHDVYK